MERVYLLKRSDGLSGLYEGENEEHSCIKFMKLDAYTCEECVEIPTNNGKTAIIKEIYLKPQKGSNTLSLYECNLDENGIEIIQRAIKQSE